MSGEEPERLEGIERYEIFLSDTEGMPSAPRGERIVVRAVATRYSMPRGVSAIAFVHPKVRLHR